MSLREDKPCSEWSDAEIRGYLRELDESEHNVSDFEASFIGQNLDRQYFSDPQRAVVARMVGKYGDL